MSFKNMFILSILTFILAICNIVLAHPEHVNRSSSVAAIDMELSSTLAASLDKPATADQVILQSADASGLHTFLNMKASDVL